MSTKTADRHGFGWAFALLATLLLLALPTLAEDLTVERYVDLTIDRLELARLTWTDEDRSPVETEEAAVCQLYQTDLDAYYSFAGEHLQQIKDYLDENTDKRDTIDSLAADIAAIIEQKEGQQ